MKLNFTYDRHKDIWCLLEKGPKSINSPFPTGVYKKLIEKVGENPDKEKTSNFIDNYLKENNYNVEKYIKKYQEEQKAISEEFEQIAEKVFGLKLNRNIKVYLTVNNRCPYNIEENFFFVTISKNSSVLTAMHELWHFYTWDKFGANQKEIGNEKYNDMKEALTVLLNIECASLLPKGVIDSGYPQHQELRDKIVLLWKENSNIDWVWQKLLNQF